MPLATRSKPSDGVFRTVTDGSPGAQGEGGGAAAVKVDQVVRTGLAEQRGQFGDGHAVWNVRKTTPGQIWEESVYRSGRAASADTGRQSTTVCPP